MADEPKQNSKSNEADASDLLGMWGSGGGDKETKSASIEAEVVSSEPTQNHGTEPEHAGGDLLEEKESLGTQFAAFLEELNIQPRHIFTGIGCLVLLVVLAFGAYKGVDYYKNWQASKPAVKPPTEVSKVDTGVPATKVVGKPIVLTDKTVGDTGISSTAQLGLESEKGNPLIEYIATFRKIQNAYSTDINELLDKSTDRRATLLAHLALLKQLYQDGTTTLSQIGSNLTALQAQFDPESKKQTDSDQTFFTQVMALDGVSAVQTLQDFIAASREMASIRANFKALQKVQSFYVVALPKVANRIHAIELNIEPLVAGIKVYDVSGAGANINLIVPVQGQQTSNDSLGSGAPSGGVLFINPQNIQTGTDYISQPGGGFQNEIQKQGTQQGGQSGQTSVPAVSPRETKP